VIKYLDESKHEKPFGSELSLIEVFMDGLFVEEVNDIIIITLPPGRLAGQEAADFKNEVQSILEKTSKLVINLTAIDYIDSAGFGAILVCRHWMKDKGGGLKIFGVSETVMKLFKLIRLDKVIDILETKKDALNALA
jgi:anti-sigma B factor antagonist